MPRSSRKSREDVLRSVLAVVVTAILASAATSAVFLAVGSSENPPADPVDVFASAAEQELAQLSPPLEELARLQEKQLQSQMAANGPEVEIQFDIGPAEETESVPMVSTERNMLTQGEVPHWHLSLTSKTQQWKYVRVTDIRRSPSLQYPGYIGAAQFEVTTLTRQHADSGKMPFQPPGGYEVISPAKYTELQQSSDYGREVLPAAGLEGTTFVFDGWKPIDPPPEDLPREVQQQFNQAILTCLEAEPVASTRTETVAFYYSLRDRKWTRRP